MDISLYQKPFSTHSYIPFNSYHHKSQLKGFIKGESIRIIRNSSSRDSYEKDLRIFIKRLLSRGYPLTFIKEALGTVNYKDRILYIQKKQKVQAPPIVLPLPSLFTHGLNSKTITSILKRKSINQRNLLLIPKTEPSLKQLIEPPKKKKYQSHSHFHSHWHSHTSTSGGKQSWKSFYKRNVLFLNPPPRTFNKIDFDNNRGRQSSNYNTK